MLPSTKPSCTVLFFSISRLARTWALDKGVQVEQRAMTWSQDSRIPIKNYKNAPEHVWRLLRAYSRPNTKERWRLWLKTASLGYIVAPQKDFSTKKDWVESRVKIKPRESWEKAWQRYFVTVTQERHTKCRLFPRLFPGSRGIQPS